MPLLPGKMTVTCPKKGEEVDVRKVCAACKSYEHISWRGLQPFVHCAYGMKLTSETKKKKVWVSTRKKNL